MPISVPGICRRPRHAGRAATGRGFTLIEIMVVVAILAIAAAVATVAVVRDERGAALREAKRLAGALEYAANRAQWRGETLGVSAEGPVIRFWRRDDASARWLALSDDDVLAARTLPEPLAAVPILYAGQPVATNAILPLRASGRNEPYAIALASPAYRVLLTADPLNRVAIDGPAALAP
jgi:general secretion pathway protein H